MRAPILALAAAILFGAQTMDPALAIDEYRVIGVAANDSLNIREGVPFAASISEAPVIGTIPPDAAGVVETGVSVTIDSSLWREVRYGGVTGWVNARYLERVGHLFGDRLPENLDCAGTEPFWSLIIRGDRASYRYETDTDYSVATRAMPANRIDRLWAVSLVREGLRAERTALVREEACSDGMSELEYSYSVVIVGSEPDVYQRGPFMGCCSLAR